MNLAYGEESGGQVTLAGGGKFDALLMSRLDVEVRVLAIPPVADKDVEGFIGLRLRSVYPGNPKETAFDFRIVREGAVRQAVVFIARRATVEKYREASGRRPLLVPYLLLSRRAPKKGDQHAWVCNGRWAEHLVFHDGLLVSSTVKRFARGSRFDLDQEEREGPSGQVVVAAPAADIEAMERIQRVQYLPLETLPAPRRGEGVFAPRTRRSVLTPALRLAVLGAAVIVLGLMVFYKEVRAVETHDARLRALITALEKGNQQVLTIQKEIDDLGAQGARLASRQPRDIYLLLSELSAVLGDGARVRTLSVRDDSFQVDAVGTNPLKLMEGFRTHPLFTGMKLAQVVPDPKTGRELFSFSGVFMPGSTTNRLLALLGGAVLLAAAAVALDLGMERLSAAQGRIALHEGQIRTLQRSVPTAMDQLVQERDALRKDVQDRAARLYAKDETDPYAFGAVIRKELASLGIAVLRYQVVDVKGASYLEFTVSGSARSFVQFLRAVSQAPKVWTIPSMTLSVEEGSGMVNVDFRIGYAIGDA